VATLPPLQPPIPEDDLNDWSRGRRRHNIGLRSKHPNMYSDVGPPSEQPAACRAPEQPPPDADSPSKQTAVPPPPEVPLPPNVDPPSQEAADFPQYLVKSLFVDGHMMNGDMMYQIWNHYILH
jgi:hypothetical protein